MAYAQLPVLEKQAPNLGNGDTMDKTLGTQAEIYPARKPFQLREANVGNDTPRFFAPLSSAPLAVGWSAPTNCDLAQYVVDPILLQFQAALAFVLDTNADLTADFNGDTFFPDPFRLDFLSDAAAQSALTLFTDGGWVQFRAQRVYDPLEEVGAAKESNWEANDWISIARVWLEALLGARGCCNSYFVDDALLAILAREEILPPPLSQLSSSQAMGLIDLESLFARSLQNDNAFTLPASSESQLYYPPLAETTGVYKPVFNCLGPNTLFLIRCGSARQGYVERENVPMHAFWEILGQILLLATENSVR
ncbi:hypothetical protein C8R44DRAFT_753398 [Mycena epipterygia]|nr:hypothetical protein C8R44DRAFT_753398 [Mycena epipterygia]